MAVKKEVTWLPVTLPETASIALVAQTYRYGRWLLSNNYLIVMPVTQGTTVTGHCIRPSGTGFITLVALFEANMTLQHTHTHVHTSASGRQRRRDKFLFQSLQFCGLRQRYCERLVMNNEDQITSKLRRPIWAQLMEGMTMKDIPIHFSCSRRYASVNGPHTYFGMRRKIWCKILYTVTVKHTSLVLRHVQCQVLYLLTLNALPPMYI
jgi:hypothetical protein